MAFSVSEIYSWRSQSLVVGVHGWMRCWAEGGSGEEERKRREDSVGVEGRPWVLYENSRIFLAKKINGCRTGVKL